MRDFRRLWRPTPYVSVPTFPESLASQLCIRINSVYRSNIHKSGLRRDARPCLNLFFVWWFYSSYNSSIEGPVTTCMGKAIVASDGATQIGPLAVFLRRHVAHTKTISHETPAINLLPQNPQHHGHATILIMFLNITLLYCTVDIAPPTNLHRNPFTLPSLLCILPRR